MPDRSTRPTPRARGAQPKQSNPWRWLFLLLGTGAFALVLSQAGGGGDDTEADATSAAGPLRTEPPWPPQSEGLRQRVADAGFPPVGDESHHVHALLSVFVDGDPVQVPANIGIDPPTGYHSPLHTHTADGVIHFEADDPAPFTLGQVFEMWGVDYSADRLGTFVPDDDRQLHVYVNGDVAADPVDVELEEGDNVVVAYGEADSSPTEPPKDALNF